MKKIRFLIAILMGAALILGACAPATETATATIPPDVISTALARTVEAMGTQIVAGLATPTPRATTTLAASSTPLILTPAAVVTSAPPAQAAQAGSDTAFTGLCDSFSFLADVSIPDGMAILPGSEFKKTWAIKNTGNCTWNSDYQLVFFSGDQMGAAGGVPVVQDGFIAPGEMAVISVPMTAPMESRRYTGFWRMRNPQGQLFGAGPNADKSLYVLIEVGNSYSFLSSLCSASWRNNDGLMYCPSKEGSAQGYYLLQEKPQLENGLYATNSLVLVPPKVQNGEITGRYAALRIPEGSVFRTNMGCGFNKTLCNVRAYITYSVDGGAEQMLAETNEYYDGLTSDVSINLDTLGLAGHMVSFTFHVETNGGPEDDLVIFQSPRISP